MKFVFPQNYDFTTKLFGFIDYSTAILNVIWSGFIFVMTNFIFENISMKLFWSIIFSFPVLLFSIIGVNGENLIYVLSYVIKYLVKQKIYFYEKKS